MVSRPYSLLMPLNNQSQQSVLCGLCGGIGSGKSYIARQFQALGAAVFDADQAGHWVLREDDVKKELVSLWGTGILDEQGEVNRQAVAQIVFASDSQGEQAREQLQAISHPRIQQQLELVLTQSSEDVVVVDAALLFETGWNVVCDQVAFVDSNEELRLGRCQARGWSIDELRRREASQWSLERKRQQADFVIENHGDSEVTQRQVQSVWQSLSRLVREEV